MLPFVHQGMEQIASLYIPPGPDGLLGARNVAMAEWYTETLESHSIGHWLRGRSSGLI